MVHVPLMFLSEWLEFLFGALRCKKESNNSPRLRVVEIARVA
jgi:hypothetical protein